MVVALALAGAGAAILVAVGFLLLRPGGPTLPANALLPPHRSTEIRLSRFAGAFEAHWEARGGRAARARAAFALLEASGDLGPLLDEMTEAELADRIEDRLGRALALLGGETRVVVARESPDRPPSWIVLSAEDSFAKAHGAALAGWFAEEESIATERLEGVRASFLRDGSDAPRVGWANVAGWLCIAGGEDARGTLAGIASRARAAAVGPREALREASDSPEADALASLPASGASGRVLPRELARDLRELGWTEKADDSDDEEGDAGGSREGSVREFVFAHAGGSPLNLDFRIALESAPSSNPSSDTREAASSESAAPGSASPESASRDFAPPPILEMDFAREFVEREAASFGIDWNAILESIEGVDWVRPGLVAALSERLAGERAGRIGWALLSDRAEPAPAALLWEDRPPLDAGGSPPADRRRALAAQRTPDDDATGGTDSILAFGDPIRRIEPAERDRVRERIELRAALAASPLPLAFVSVDFDELAESTRAFPAIVLDDDAREGWRTFVPLAEALAEGLGSAVARLEREGEGLRLVLRVAPLPASGSWRDPLDSPR